MWMDQYVAKSGTPASDKIQTFRVVRPAGLYYNSEPAAVGSGVQRRGHLHRADRQRRILGIWPIAGGSGPYPTQATRCSRSSTPGRRATRWRPRSLPPAGNAVVGAPTLSFTYSGLGTASAVYAQLVDNKSGLVAEQHRDSGPGDARRQDPHGSPSTWRTSPTPRRETR